jgi:aminoglycoside phosphotransferase (APT) family kinase protein
MAQVSDIERRLAAYLNASLASFKILDAGWETIIFEFVLATRSGPSANLPLETPLVLRFYEGTRAQDKSLREVAVLRRLAADGFPVPVAYLFEPDFEPLGAPFLVMQRLDGGPLFASRSFPQAFKTFALGFFAFVRTQARLHRITALANDYPRAYQAAGIAPDAPLLDRLLGIIGDRIERGPLSGLKAALVRLHEQADRLRAGPEAPLHMDYHPQNVLVQGLHVTGVIDWVNADRGDRHLDAATTSVILATSAMDHPRWMRDNVAGNFLRANFASMYLPLYHAMLPMELARFRYCQGVAALLRLSMFGMMRMRGADAAGFRPEAMRNVTPSVVRLLSRYATRKIGVPTSI